MPNDFSKKAEFTVLEGMTSVSALLAARERGENDRPIRKILFDREKRVKKSREWRFLSDRCASENIPLLTVDAEEIASLATGSTHGGVIALCGERTVPALSAENLPQNAFLCLLDGIEDPYNFGYALRSLYAAGCGGVLLGTRNWMSAAGTVARASAGASEALPLFSGDPVTAVRTAKEGGYRVAAAGIRYSVPFHSADLSLPLLLIVGGEKRGISAPLLALADTVVRIDYGRTFRGSLSSSAAAAVLAFEVLRQNGKKE